MVTSYDIELVFLQKIAFILRKSTKTTATRAQKLFLTPICTKLFIGWVFTPSYSDPPHFLAVPMGSTSKRRGKECTRGESTAEREGKVNEGKL